MKIDGSFRKILSIILVFIMLLTMIIVVGYNNFIHHKNTVIKQQQEHLLTIAKSISRSLDVFINYKTNSLSVLAKEPIIIKALKMDEGGEVYYRHEEVLETFFEKYKDEMERVLLFNNKGKLIYQYPVENSTKGKVIEDSTISRVLNSKQVFISKEYLSNYNQFSIDILNPVINNNEVIGVLVNTINLNKMYKSLIHPIRSGEKGYAMVKNMDGVIVMHPVTDQIGIESIKVRKKKFPQNDWTELEELNRRQVEEGEGYFVYHSKWWQDTEKELTKKINAYTTFKKGDISWSISVQMGYEEIEEPIKGTLINISLISLIIAAILISGLYIIFKMDKKRKALEIEAKYLKELNKAWEELIKSEARLRHSQKLETIGTLTSGVAHEFNNLLSPILGYSEILLQSIDDNNTMQEDILEINKSALRAKELIGQILAFSRDDTTVPKFKYLEVNYVVKESIKLIKSILPNSIKIVENINSNQLIFGNLTQLQQVLLNLYTNSYHSMKSKDGVLEVNTEDVYISHKEWEKLNLQNGNYVKIQVKDNGAGMNEETLEQIFDYYFTTKETGKGTGLGLPVVRSIVEKHKGRIFVRSQVDVGTSVDIYLPAIEENYNANLNEF